MEVRTGVFKYVFSSLLNWDPDSEGAKQKAKD